MFPVSLKSPVNAYLDSKSLVGTSSSHPQLPHSCNPHWWISMHLKPWLVSMIQVHILRYMSSIKTEHTVLDLVQNTHKKMCWILTHQSHTHFWVFYHAEIKQLIVWFMNQVKTVLEDINLCKMFNYTMLCITTWVHKHSSFYSNRLSLLIIKSR